MVDALDGVIDRAELEDFERRHPAFRAALTRLQNKLQESLVRSATPVPERPAALQLVVFFLSHQAADDFFEIVLLAVHGYGFGALKLLRSLYERVVTTMYLMIHPDEVSDFNLYADLHAYRVLEHARATGFDIRKLMPPEQIAAVEAAYQEAKQRFGRQPSWTRKNLKMQADEVGLGQLYIFCALAPTLELHSTRVGLEGRLSRLGTAVAFAHGPRRVEADLALCSAHDLIVYLLSKTSEFFGWGLDVSDIATDVQRCWGGSHLP